MNDVDTASLKFAGAVPLRVDTADTNSDARLDLVIHFAQAGLRLGPQATSARLTGWLKNSQAISGTAPVSVASPDNY